MAANNNKVQSLQKEFPDMTQSMLGDILTTYNNDSKKAAEALRNIENENKKEEQKKKNELKELFPTLPEKVIVDALKVANWNVEEAIVPLFNKAEELKQKEKQDQTNRSRQKRVEEERRRKEEETKKKAAQLLDLFNNIPKEKIQELLDENEGDIEETTNQLLMIVAKQEEEKREVERKRKEEADKFQREQERRLRDLKVQALSEKFEDLAESDVVAALETSNWDIKSALGKLLTLSADKKKAELKQLFPAMSSEEIETALDANNWDKSKALQALVNLERSKREQEEARKLQEQQEAKKVEAPVVKKEEAPVVVKKVRQNLLDKSIILGQKMEDDIINQSQLQFKHEDEEKKAAAKQLFKEDLEHIIATQARHGTTPGLQPPPLPKQIDAMLGKARPIEESESNTVQPAPVNIEPPVKTELLLMKEQTNSSSSELVVNLIAPAVVDVGATITVQFEIVKGQSTPKDWIGFFPADQTNKQYLTYQWRGKEEHKGTVTFAAPSTFGEYEFRYFPNGSYQHAAMSNRVKVGPQFDLQARVDPDAKKVYVKWDQLSGNYYPRAWIGFYEKSQTNNHSYLAWDYAIGKLHNELSFDAPVKPQQYEFRLFSNSYVDVARSNPITIEGADSISATYKDGIVTLSLHIVSVDPYYDTAWVGIYFTHETNNRQWRRYKYISDRNADVQFKAPRTPGEYEVRLFANKSYDLLLKSNKFVISDSNNNNNDNKEQ